MSALYTYTLDDFDVVEGASVVLITVNITSTTNCSFPSETGDMCLNPLSTLAGGMGTEYSTAGTLVKDQKGSLDDNGVRMYRLLWNACLVSKNSPYFIYLDSYDGVVNYTIDITVTDSRPYVPRCAVDSSKPSLRRSHSVVEYEGTLLMFGGMKVVSSASKSTASEAEFLTVQTDEAVTQELYRFFPSNSSWSLMEGSSQSFRPTARFGHGSVVWSHYMFVFGGSDNRTCFNDLWLLHVQGSQTDLITTPPMTWTRLLPVSPSSSPTPSPRAFHSQLLMLPDVMFVFAGRGSDGLPLQDLWELRLGPTVQSATATWTLVDSPKLSEQPFSAVPSRRFGHSAVLYGSKMVVYGGVGEGNTYLNDLWVFDTASYLWAQVPFQAGVNGPTYGRAFHGSVLVGDVMVTVGGEMDSTSSSLTGSIWHYQLASGQWVQVYDPPLSRLRASHYVSETPLLLTSFQDSLLSVGGRSLMHPKSNKIQLLMLAERVCHKTSEELSTGCLPCPAGTYVLAGSAASALPWVTGPQCVSCRAGSYSNDTQAPACSPCPAGTYGDTPKTVARSLCKPCNSGTYNPLPFQSSCQVCSGNADTVCPLATVKPLDGPLVTKDKFIHEDNEPQVSIALPTDESYWQRLLFTAGGITILLFACAVWLLHTVKRQMTTEFFALCDFPPVVGGNGGTFAGGFLSILYIILFITIFSAMVVRLMYFNVRTEASPIPSTNEADAVPVTFIGKFRSFGYNGPCLAASGNDTCHPDIVRRVVGFAPKSARDSHTFSCGLETVETVQSDNPSASGAVPAGAENSCTVKWICPRCLVQQDDALIEVRFGNRESYAQGIWWSFKGVWPEANLQGYSAVSAVARPDTDGAVWKGSASTVVSLSLIPTYYVNQITSDDITGYRIQYVSTHPGSQASFSTFYTMQDSPGIQVKVNFATSHFQILVMALQTGLDFVTKVFALLAGMSFAGRVTRYVWLSNQGHFFSSLASKCWHCCCCAVFWAQSVASPRANRSAVRPDKEGLGSRMDQGTGLRSNELEVELAHIDRPRLPLSSPLLQHYGEDDSTGLASVGTGFTPSSRPRSRSPSFDEEAIPDDPEAEDTDTFRTWAQGPSLASNRTY
eukprot:GILK01009631.1.p1 GENE.GILK01009631.1~~GILK01009631.1.p1  ORF type:complete len:1183 (+),score=174.25 GILK01009631.1:226-3549(+)